MATIDAAAVWRAKKLVTYAACAAFVGFALGGCGTTTSLFSGDSTTQEQQLANSATPQNGVAQAAGSKVAIAPVIGAPDLIAKHLKNELGQALAKSSIQVASSPSEAAAYTLRGYVVSARESAGTKISYIWDVTDSTGKRVNRITGEEIAKGSGSDPWAAMTPSIVQSISTKTASSLAAWLPTQRTAAVSTRPIGASAPTVASTTPTTPLAPPSTNATGTASETTTGSINKAGKVAAILPNVTGAPGDGGVSLTNAMRSELVRNGIGMASTGTPSTYKVVGRVIAQPPKDGTQPIRIDWDVHDPSGRKLGTVTQNNKIPPGSLDGAWGKTANMAAAAATQGILKLLPKPTKTN